ncbi:MAG: GNAT family N-acetyltransferase [Dongiaceae bacterium]
MEQAARIRHARPGDAAIVVQLIRELAAYEREPASSVRVSEADLLRDGFGATPRFELLVAELGGTVVGFALFFTSWSTWEGRPGLYLEDLFVRETARGRGLGRRLLAAIARLALERGYPRLDLCVLDWNPARRFYDSLGMGERQNWRPYRLEADGIARLAAGEPAPPAT